VGFKGPTSKEKGGMQGREGARVCKGKKGGRKREGARGRKKGRERMENGRGKKGAGRGYSPYQS